MDATQETPATLPNPKQFTSPRVVEMAETAIFLAAVGMSKEHAVSFAVAVCSPLREREVAVSAQEILKALSCGKKDGPSSAYAG